VRNQPGVWLAAEISAEALAATLFEALTSLRPGQRFAHSWIEEFRLDRAIQACECLIDAVLEEREKYCRSHQ
jgi:hypothetical protein